jgi:hypothetical protein
MDSIGIVHSNMIEKIVLLFLCVAGIAAVACDLTRRRGLTPDERRLEDEEREEERFYW